MSEFINRIAKTKPKRDFFDHAYISFKHRYAMHTVGKAANSTVKFLLYQLELEGTHLRMPSVHERAKSPLLSPYQLSETDLETVFAGDEFFRFTFVRNPYSRLLSCYLDRIVGGNTRPARELLRTMGKEDTYEPSFEEFIKTICDQSVHAQNNNWRVQYYDCMCNEIDYHFIGKQESFSKDFLHVYKKVAGVAPQDGALATNASPSKTSAAERLEEYWTAELKDLVDTKYENDFSFFRYKMDL
ncbi:MAG: sulfotransferase family 2 domain-containing protein [Roseovarius sp.]|nr:sulfotransferase family 2 domain-containing protein [Roseovarius sp.]